MNNDEIVVRLDRLFSSPSFSVGAEELVTELSKSPNSFGAVEPVLRFMEHHPSADFGLPGPLVHFVERFFGRGYEEKLIESVQRHPTPHTLWMLNRVVNGTRTPVDRNRLVEILKHVADDPSVDEGTRQAAARFVARQSS